MNPENERTPGQNNKAEAGELKNFSHEELQIRVMVNDKKVDMEWTGKSRDRNPSAVLVPYLNGIADSLSGKSLVCSFVKLEFMNSSTVPAIISFVDALEKNGIKSIIYYNMELEWQVASFSALAVITKFMENVVLEGK